MRNKTSLNCLVILLLATIVGTVVAADKKKMPRENVIEFLAIGEGLF